MIVYLKFVIKRLFYCKRFNFDEKKTVLACDIQKQDSCNPKLATIMGIQENPFFNIYILNVLAYRTYIWTNTKHAFGRDFL